MARIAGAVHRDDFENTLERLREFVNSSGAVVAGERKKDLGILLDVCSGDRAVVPVDPDSLEETAAVLYRAVRVARERRSEALFLQPGPAPGEKDDEFPRTYGFTADGMADVVSAVRAFLLGTRRGTAERYVEIVFPGTPREEIVTAIAVNEKDEPVSGVVLRPGDDSGSPRFRIYPEAFAEPDSKETKDAPDEWFDGGAEVQEIPAVEVGSFGPSAKALEFLDDLPARILVLDAQLREQGYGGDRRLEIVKDYLETVRTLLGPTVFSGPLPEIVSTDAAGVDERRRFLLGFRKESGDNVHYFGTEIELAMKKYLADRVGLGESVTVVVE